MIYLSSSQASSFSCNWDKFLSGGVRRNLYEIFYDWRERTNCRKCANVRLKSEVHGMHTFPFFLLFRVKIILLQKRQENLGKLFIIC